MNHAPIRALVVDDNRPLAENLAEILREEGCEVHMFDNALAAAREAPRLHFELALLDVRMPGIDGIALHRELLRAHPEACFILMTAHADDLRLALARAAGARCILTKPVAVDELLSRVHELIAELRGAPA